MMKKQITLLLFLLIVPFLHAQTISRIEPPNWWTGMKWNKVQVMVHGEKIAADFPMIKMGPKGLNLAKGVNLVKINRVENPNYIFLDLVIDATAKPGIIQFPFLKNINFIKFEIEEDITTINIERLDNELILKKNDNYPTKILIFINDNCDTINYQRIED